MPLVERVEHRNQYKSSRDKQAGRRDFIPDQRNG
mgnify:CR=1 FL=1